MPTQLSEAQYKVHSGGQCGEVNTVLTSAIFFYRNHLFWNGPDRME